MSRPAIFLDRDGTIIAEREYLCDPDGAVLEEGAADGLLVMAAMGYPLVVVSNQSGVSRGYFDAAAVDAVNARVAELLAHHRIEILAWYSCPHGPGEACACRKPLPGMVLEAARTFDLDLARSFVIGDKRSDVELAHACGATGILVITGHGAQDAAWASDNGYPVCRDLREAADIVRAGSP